MVAGHDGPAEAPRPNRVPFRCPHCALDLGVQGREFRCERGHSFDRAREGYVNLLVGGRLAGGPSGDDDAMVRARRAVFDAGLYDPLIDAIAARADDASPSTVLDAGCGEGSYLARVTDSTDAMGHGIDISKTAIRLAARRHDAHQYAVASSFRLPFADEAFDVVVNVFSPRPFDEMLRVLRPGGFAVVATPGAGHLAQLKALVYDRPREHIELDDAEQCGAFHRIDVGRVAFELVLDDPELRLRLLEMTPYWWSTSTARRERIAAESFEVDVDVLVTTYRRPG